MVAGLQHLHTEVGIVHGDLKAVFFFSCSYYTSAQNFLYHFLE